MFSGLVFCNDCKQKLYYSTTSYFEKRQDFFICSTHRDNKDKCSGHFIRAVVLEQIVWKHIQEVISVVTRYEAYFRSEMEQKLRMQSEESLRLYQKRLAQAEKRIGETTVVCWAEGAEPAYRKYTFAAIFGGPLPEQISTDTLRSTVKYLAEGRPCEELKLDPNRRFYILGLSPNAARLSVRFFYCSTFGDVMKNVNDHHDRMEVVGSKHEWISLWAMLRETVNLNTTDKAPSPAMAGATARAIFSGTAYPASLLEAVMLRIRAERDITPGRAAILKAYYLKNPNLQCPKEVLTVSLNENSTNVPYTLGRLFSVYEAVQEWANPGINATIKDKYFNSAAATPAVIFPILDNLCQKHLRKLEVGKRIYCERQIGDLKNRLGESNPMRLTLPEQGSFNLGYYHQKQLRYTKKEEQ